MVQTSSMLFKKAYEDPEEQERTLNIKGDIQKLPKRNLISLGNIFSFIEPWYRNSYIKGNYVAVWARKNFNLGVTFDSSPHSLHFQPIIYSVLSTFRGLSLSQSCSSLIWILERSSSLLIKEDCACCPASISVFSWQLDSKISFGEKKSLSHPQSHNLGGINCTFSSRSGF